MPQELLLEFSPREHISAFQISLFSGKNGCPARYYETYKQHSQLTSKTLASVVEFGVVIHDLVDNLTKEAVTNFGNCRLYEIFTIEDVIDRFKLFITRSPLLCSDYFINRGNEQLRFWYLKEQEREAEVFVFSDPVSGDQVIGSEVPFNLYLPNGVLILGFIDRVEKNKYTKNNELQLIDWKTGYLEDDYSDNMMIYELAMSMSVKEYKYKSQILQFENRHHTKYTFEESDKEKFYNKVAIIRESILEFANNIAEILKLEDCEKQLNTFLDSVANVNTWCYTCPRRNRCVPYIKRILIGLPGMSVDESNPQMLIDFKEQLAVVKKNCEKQIEQIDEVLIDIISKHGKNNIVDIDNGKAITFKYPCQRRVDSKIAVPLLIEHGFKDKLGIGVGYYETILKSLCGSISSEEMEKFESAIDKKYSKDPKIDIVNKKEESDEK